MGIIFVYNLKCRFLSHNFKSSGIFSRVFGLILELLEYSGFLEQQIHTLNTFQFIRYPSMFLEKSEFFLFFGIKLTQYWHVFYVLISYESWLLSFSEACNTLDWVRKWLPDFIVEKTQLALFSCLNNSYQLLIKMLGLFLI